MCNLWHNVNRINNLFASRHLTTIPIVSGKKVPVGTLEDKGLRLSVQDSLETDFTF